MQYYVFIYIIYIYIYTYTAVLYTLKVYITHHMYTNHHTAPDSMETLFFKAPAALPGNCRCLGLQTAHIGGKVRFTKLTTCVVRSCWVPCPYPDGSCAVRECPTNEGYPKRPNGFFDENDGQSDKDMDF